MPYVTLKRTPTPNTAPATGFSVEYWLYDTTTRRESRDVVQSATDTGNFAPFELPPDSLVPGASFCINQMLRQVRYNGQGGVYTQDVPDAPACASSLAGITVTPSGQPKIDSVEGVLTVEWYGGTAPFLVRCGLLEPGREGVAPFYQELTTTGQTAQFPPANPGTTSLYAGQNGRGPFRLTSFTEIGLGPGLYRVEVTDATGYTVSVDMVLAPHLPGQPRTILLNHNDGANTARLELVLPVGKQLLQVVLTRLDANRLRVAHSVWNPAAGEVEAYTYTLVAGTLSSAGTGTHLVVQYESSSGAPRVPVYAVGSTSFTLPAGVLLGLLPASTAAVCSDGQGGVYVRGTQARQQLRLENLILFHPDRPNDGGGVVLEANLQAAHPAPPLTFTLTEVTTSGGSQSVDNTTGRFSGLAAGTYLYSINSTAPGVLPTSGQFTLSARYGLRYKLESDDLKNGRPWRVELWRRGYSGPVEVLCGQGEAPVILDSQGLEGGPLQADLPDAIGTACTLNLLALPGQLEDLVLDDRACRVDLYYDAELLKFRGYVEAGLSSEPLLSGKIPVTLTATCGLAALEDVDFAGHVGQELRGRWPVLNTLLHCLSRCDVALPLQLFANRRAVEMSSAEEPELALYTDRLAYLEGDKPMSCRAVVDKLSQLLGGTLVQRQGRWELRSTLEAERPVRGRAYRVGGVGSGSPEVLPPAATILPPTMATLGAPQNWHWREGSQTRQRRGGWRSLTATADAAYAANAFRAGEYLRLPWAWNAAGAALRPETGWRPDAADPGGASFPLALAEAGRQAGEYAANWPGPGTGIGIVTRTATGVIPGAPSRYLESEPILLGAGREGLPMRLKVRARFVPLTARATPGTTATVLVELLSEQPAGPSFGGQLVVSTGHVLSFPIGGTDYTERVVDIPFGLPARFGQGRVRLHPHRTNDTRRAAIGGGPVSAFLLESVVLQVLPQGAEWEAATETTVRGAGGTVRPTQALEVFHVDAPDAAGLFAGNAAAFRRAVTRGLTGPTSAWARPDDLRPAPLLDCAALDVMALRSRPSRVLTGEVRHLFPAGYATDAVPEILDAVDAPFDINGRRWAVASRRWNVKQARTEITLLEIGVGQWLSPPTYQLPENVRVLDTLQQGRRRVRVTHDGYRTVND